MVERFSAPGLRVHTPFGPRKSGMPESVLIPAPVSTATERASAISASASARPAGSGSSRLTTGCRDPRRTGPDRGPTRRRRRDRSVGAVVDRCGLAALDVAQRQLLGEGLHPLFEAAHVHREVDAHDEQEQDRQREHEAGAVDDADGVREAVDERPGEGQERAHHGDADPEQGVALREPAAPDDLDDDRQDDEHRDEQHDLELHAAGPPASGRRSGCMAMTSVSRHRW